ncbi:MAG: exodeoxyribonuclease III [Leptospirales bacterium]|nr:exodeoxyribonuclease III [Leptospirales bacterium]
MRLISWNVNGIRSCLGKGFLEFVTREAPDVLCLQETRGYPPQIDQLLPGYQKLWSHAEKKGYSGTAIFVKESLAATPLKPGIGKTEHDREGRVLGVDLGDFILVNVYTPNSGEDLKRLEYRQIWDREFASYIKKLQKKKPVALCGDLNVAHKEIDLARPQANRKNAGFTDEERAGLDRLLAVGLLDTFRSLYPERREAYSWWSFRAGSRARNIGWRIDYFLISEALRPRLQEAWISPETPGSDHCPVGLQLR